MARLTVKVTPGARRDECLGYLDDGVTLRIRLRAPAVDGKANKALVAFLSDLIGVPKPAIAILRGETSRTKIVEIATLSDAALAQIAFP